MAFTLTRHPFTVWQSWQLAPNWRRWMSAWQVAHCLPTLVNTFFTWQELHATCSCMPLSAYLVSVLWLNSGAWRMGVQLVVVWQFSHAIARGPCGFRKRVELIVWASNRPKTLNARDVKSTPRQHN